MRQVLAPLALIVIILGTASLGNWQLNRAEFKRELQRQRDAASRASPLTIDTRVLRADEAANRRVIASGTWFDDATIFIDNRTHNGVAGFHVITPLLLGTNEAGDRTSIDTSNVTDNAGADEKKQTDSPVFVLVLRGWVAANRQDRNLLPRFESTPEPVRISGLSQLVLPQSLQLGSPVAPGPQDRLWQYFDLAGYEQWFAAHRSAALQPFVIRQFDSPENSGVAAPGAGRATVAQPQPGARGQPGTPARLVRDWPVPSDGINKHLGYAFQWFAMSFAALTFALWRTIRRRSGSRAAR